jgi:putative hydrolase of the HAD superfamily
MNASRIRYVIFDLGGTLMHARADWAPIHERADQALVDSLHQHGIDLDPRVFRERLHGYYAQRDRDHHETTYHLVLRELLTELGHADVAEPVLRSALDALYDITQPNWELESDALETLLRLKAEKYHIGILSNAGDDKDVQELIQSFGIRPQLDFVLTSAACFYRKPHARAFELALAHWNATPEEAVMVGDSLEADIMGAQNLGMKAVWISRRAKFSEDEMQRIKPDFSLRKLPELLPTLDMLSMPRMR